MTVVNFEEYKRNRKDNVKLVFLDDMTRIQIVSTDEKRTYLNEKYQRRVYMSEFDALVDHFKAKHPNCVCVDF